jgi:flagellar motor switch protein FliN
VPDTIDTVLRLSVPIIVRLGERSMTVTDVLALVPGAIIELPKNAGAELDLMVNNRVIGLGSAMKVGENFGLRITRIGDEDERLAAAQASTDEAGLGEGPLGP